MLVPGEAGCRDKTMITGRRMHLSLLRSGRMTWARANSLLFETIYSVARLIFVVEGRESLVLLLKIAHVFSSCTVLYVDT
jgi:hypothetical protein